MKELFRQFVLPETTSMCPPPNKVAIKGVPNKDKQIIRSRRWSPLLWEIVDSEEQQTHGSQKKSTGTSRKSARKSNMSPTPPKPIPKNLKPIPVKVHIPYKDQIPLWMHDFIEEVEDVPGDGHCGFRAVAVLRNLIVDDQQIIRYHLYKELVGVENACYRRMINDDRRYKEVSDALSFSGIGNAPPKKWMIMPDMGFLIAQKLNHAVVVLSIGKGRSKTYFPLCGPPPCIDRVMCLSYVNDNHFMAVDFKDGCLIPPTCPLWRRHSREDAQNWPDRYVSRMTDYNELSRAAAGEEVIGDEEELYIIENLDPDERVGPGPGPGVKVEVDDSLIDLSAP